jgi:uncharacterized membrane protein
VAFDQARRQRILRRYRFMFKATIVEFAVSMLMLAVGVVIAIASSDTTLIGWSVILIALTVVNGYKILNSTVKVLEAEATENSWHELA